MDNEILTNATKITSKVAKKAVSSIIKTIIMLGILVFEFILIAFLMKENFPNVQGPLLIGIVFNIIYMIVAFFVKKVRTLPVIWFGICSLGLTIWWIYLLTKI